MPANSLVPSKIRDSASPFKTLVRKVRETFVLGMQNIEQEKVRTYWKAGEHIQKYILLNKTRADLGDRTIEKLAERIEVNKSILQRCRQFAEKYPVVATWRQLTWSHFRLLIPIFDEKTRLEMTERANREGWTVEKLESKIRVVRSLESKNGNEGKSQKTKSVLFRPKLGKLNVYKIIKSEEDELLLDLGFSASCGLAEEERKKFSEGDFVEVKGRELVKIKGSAADLYTYQAYVERVIDGDTIWMNVHLGYDIRIRQKLRLRGIDAPELKTEAGEKARRFVESKLAAASRVKITTTRPDKYDRYLSDVWFQENHSGESENRWINLNKLLLETGHARVKTDYSESDWDLSNWGRF